VPINAPEPIRLPPQAWDPHGPLIQACRDHDANTLFRIVHERYGIIQERLAILAGIPAGEISKRIHNRRGPLIHLRRWIDIAHALGMPDHARRVLFDLPPVEPAATVRAGAQPASAPAGTSVVLRAEVMSNPELPERFTQPAAKPASDIASWLGVRTAALFAVIDGWQGHAEDPSSLQDLLHQEILMFDAADTNNPPESAFAASRRQALASLAALPLAFAFSSAATGAAADADRERFLAHCSASLTACWHLLRGSDIHAVDTMLSAYLVRLDGLARQASRHQRTAALLASQAHRIAGILALHRNNLSARERHFQQACHYARISEDPRAQAAALISLGSSYVYNSDNPARAASAYKEALTITGLSPLQRSRLPAELAIAQARLGREDDALNGTDLAAKRYPDQPEHDEAFLYADFSPASLTLTRGLAYLALAEHHPDRAYAKRAFDTFEQMHGPTQAPAPDRIVFEIANHQASAAVLLADLDAFETHLAHGIDGAILLRSQVRLAEAGSAWQRANQRWPREQRVKQLGDQLHTSQCQALTPFTA